MATSESTVGFILEQLNGLVDIRVRKMFGEYALYYRDKVVGLICDDTLFLKITDGGRQMLKDAYKEGFPYPGAKPYIEVRETLENETDLKKLVELTELGIKRKTLK